MKIEFGTIYKGDSLEILPQLETKSIDMIFTSPPFKDEDVAGDYWGFYDKWFKEALRIAKKCVIVIHSATKLNEIITRYPPKRTMIWGKGIVAYSWRYNPIFIYQINDGYKVNKFIWSDVLGVAPIRGDKKTNKYQDPDLLYSTIISMFKGCDTILDPFIGGGTTMRAAKENGRSCIGIEIL